MNWGYRCPGGRIRHVSNFRKNVLTLFRKRREKMNQEKEGKSNASFPSSFPSFPSFLPQFG